MNLKNLTNQTILSQTLTLVNSERKIGTEILWHLQEIEQRYIYADLGYASLFEFVTKHLFYSEGSAHRRIDAMRLLKGLELPKQAEVKMKLESGQLNVTHLAQVQQHIRNMKKVGIQVSACEKANLIEEVSGNSKLEVERILASKLPEPPPMNTQVKAAGANKVSLTLEMTIEDYENLKELHELLGGSDIRHALIKAVKIALKQEKKKKEQKNQNPASGVNQNASVKEPISEGLGSKNGVSQDIVKQDSVRKDIVSQKIISQQLDNSPLLDGLKFPKQNSSRFISVKIKRAVSQTDQNQCTFLTQEGKRCESKFKLEYDHIVPFATGGSNLVGNLRLRCRAHNLAHARNFFGAKKMDSFRKHH